MITGKLSTLVRENCFQDSLKQTILKRSKWTKEEFGSIDWDIFGKVFRSCSRFHQISLAKFVHGLWNTGEQKVLFKQEDTGLCSCCNSVMETTSHVFQCRAMAMVEHRTDRLAQFYEYLDAQELPKPLKQCMYAGMVGWMDSTVDKSNLHAPTRGDLMPAAQMATKTFMDQSQLGWGAFFKGQLSCSWRKAILFSNPIWDEDVTETHLRGIIRRLHTISLAVWACRNGILHGDTFDKKRELRSKLIREKVAEAYALFTAGELYLLARDKALFRKKTLEQRLKGDDDSLFCWLRSVEVAMTVFERRQAKYSTNAAVFFRPFREMGQQKLRAQRLDSLISNREVDQAWQNQRTPSYAEGFYTQTEADQLIADVSTSTQSQYSQRKAKNPILLGLSDTILSREWDSAQHSLDNGVMDDSSMESAGPFAEGPIIDQHFTSDSSYVPSRRRDVALSFDTITSSSATDMTPEGYRAARRVQRMRRIDDLIKYLGKGSLAFSEDDQLSALMTNGSWHDSDKQDASVEFSTSTDSSLIGSITAQEMLRFPLHRIMNTCTSADESSLSEPALEGLGAVISERVESYNPLVDSGSGSSDGIGSLAKAETVVPGKVRIEELSIGSGYSSLEKRETICHVDLQMAQDSADSLTGSSPIDQYESPLASIVRIVELQAFVQPVPIAGEALAFSDDSGGHTDSTGGILEKILSGSEEGDRSLSPAEFTRSEINSTASFSGTSSTDSADSVDLAWRTLPLAPPQVGGFDNDSVPSLVEGHTPESSSDIQSDGDIDELFDTNAEIEDALQVGDDQIFIGEADAELSLTGEANNIQQIVHGMVQGMAISPWEYGLSLQQLYLAEQEAYSQQVNEGSHQSESAISIASSLETFSNGDDTEASTTSYLSGISVRVVETGNRLRDISGTQIPYKEQDDPPDADG